MIQKCLYIQVKKKVCFFKNIFGLTRRGRPPNTLPTLFSKEGSLSNHGQMV